MTQDGVVIAEFDNFADKYEELVNASLKYLPVKVKYFTKVKADYFLDLFWRSHFSAAEGLNVLDVGCGTGNLHPLIAGHLGSVSGVDVSLASLEYAQQANPTVDYRHYDGTRLPYGDGQFDAAFTVCVMHHVPPTQWASFLREMRRVVRPGGCVVVFEHNPRNPLTRQIVARSELDTEAVLLHMRQTATLLVEADLADAVVRSILSILPWGPLTRRLDLMLGRIGLGAQYFAMARV